MALTLSQTAAGSIYSFGEATCRSTNTYVCTVGGIGSGSLSVGVNSAGAGVTRPIGYHVRPGTPGTATWVGAAVVMLDITTGNTNVTWGGLRWCVICHDGSVPVSASAITTTSALGISLGTTGVKTASVETGEAGFSGFCNTASAAAAFFLEMSSIATMVATFNFRNDQVIILPTTTGAAPAAEVFNLATTRAGK